MKRTRKGTTRPSRRRWRSFGFLLHQTLQNSVPYGMYGKSMQLYSAKADAEMAGDDFVRLARGHQLKDLTLAGCQRGGADLQCRAFKALLVRPVIPMQGSLDAFEQDVLAQWLLDKVEGPSLHRCDRQRNCALVGDEYHRNASAADIELLLHFEPSHLRHSHIEQ